MFVVDLTKLRPADASSAAIRDAIERVKLAVAQATANADAAKAARDGLLLDGTAAELSKGEKTLAEARETVERIEAMDGQLSTRLVDAKRREVAGAVNAKAAVADDLTRQFNEAWERDFPRLQGELIALLAQGVAASDARGDCRHAYERALRWDDVTEAEATAGTVDLELGEVSLHDLKTKIEDFPYFHLSK